MKERHDGWQRKTHKDYIKLFLAGFVALVVFGGIFNYLHETRASKDASFVVARESEKRAPAPTEPQERTAAGGEDALPTEVVVHVTGAVKHPGVYTFDGNARANDAVQKAVPAEDADINALNLAARLIDGDRLVVPRQGETPEAGAALAPADSGAKVSLNRATAEELERLPGIGATKAQAILLYREKHGGFKSLDELKEVSGIGEKTFEQLADAIAL